MRRWLFEQSLSLVFLVAFLLSLVGQSIAGLHVKPVGAPHTETGSSG